jgi:hypothetical protein
MTTAEARRQLHMVLQGLTPEKVRTAREAVIVLHELRAEQRPFNAPTWEVATDRSRSGTSARGSKRRNPPVSRSRAEGGRPSRGRVTMETYLSRIYATLLADPDYQRVD